MNLTREKARSEREKEKGEIRLEEGKKGRKKEGGSLKKKEMGERQRHRQHSKEE